jgi:hypothetical protein
MFLSKPSAQNGHLAKTPEITIQISSYRSFSEFDLRYGKPMKDFKVTVYTPV